MGFSYLNKNMVKQGHQNFYLHENGKFCQAYVFINAQLHNSQEVQKNTFKEKEMAPINMVSRKAWSSSPSVQPSSLAGGPLNPRQTISAGTSQVGLDSKEYFEIVF